MLVESGGHTLGAEAFTPVGSYLPVRFDAIVATVLKDGVCVDRRNGTPMEMDAYSSYLAAKAHERAGLGAFREVRAALVRGIENRRQKCAGFWEHGAWTDLEGEIHLRFTAAAIRLLAEAHLDGLYPDTDALLNCLRRHLAYADQLTIGTWFLHDSFETDALGPLAPEKPVAARAWGASEYNCLVLNTHVDTLTTIICVLDQVTMSATERDELSAVVRSATRTLIASLTKRHSFGARAFGLLDGAVRSFMLRTNHVDTRIVRFVRWRIIDYYYSARRGIKTSRMMLNFPDGYLERDLRLLGYHFDYHLYTLHDLVRFRSIAANLEFIAGAEMAFLEDVIDAAIDYACRLPYRSWIEESVQQNGRAALLCEAILARASFAPQFSFPRDWRDMFSAIIDHVPDTPGLLGYDPAIVSALVRRGDDRIFQLIDGTEVAVDAASRRPEVIRSLHHG